LSAGGVEIIDQMLGANFILHTSTFNELKQLSISSHATELKKTKRVWETTRKSHRCARTVCARLS
jgi:hypothetical protein